MTTVKEMIEFLSQFEENSEILLGSFNSICGDGSFSLKYGYGVNHEGDVLEKEDIEDRIKELEGRSEKVKPYFTKTELKCATIEYSKQIKELEQSLEKVKPIIYIHN